jgi:GST-like protein
MRGIAKSEAHKSEGGRVTITVYGGGSPNVHKVEIMLSELSLDYGIQVIDIYRGENFSEYYSAISPTQKVPAILDPEGPGGEPITMFDSGAILIYLAEKTGRFLSLDGVDRAITLQWLMFQMSAVGPVLGQLMHFSASPDVDSGDYALRRFISTSRRIFDTLESRLSQSPFLGGEAYTIADIATFAWTRLAPKRFGDVYPVLGEDWPIFPNVRRWSAEIGARPAVERALAQADSRQYTRDEASPEEMDRLFGRGKAERSLLL